VARAGAVFDNAISPASWTLPAHMSIFTALYPSFHKVEASGVKLDDSVHTLPQILEAAGYTTAGFVTGSFLAASWGFGRGFGIYDIQFADAAEQTKRAMLWLDWYRFHVYRGLAPPRFFLFVHYLDPHETYAPPPAYRERFAGGYTGQLQPSDHLVTVYGDKAFERPEDFRYAVGLYDGEIAFVDASLKPLFEKLRAMDLEDRTLVVLTSDHGEEFKDHGSMGHKKTLYDEQLRVPLIMRYPGVIEGNQRVSRQVSLVDLQPTILDLVGLEPRGTVQGTSLLAHLALRRPGGQRPPHSPAPVFAELGPLGSPWERTFRRRVIRTEQRKLIVNYLEDGTVEKELYLLESDAGEKANVYAAQKDGPEVRALETGLGAFIQRGRNANTAFRERNRVTEVDLPDHVLEQLRALGYLQPRRR
jgi:arylsulfatase A-like enzyme